MNTLKFGSLFTGIGGIDLGFEQAGMQCVWQCEIDDRCREWLTKRWPEAEQLKDVRLMKGEVRWVDVICGGFPCQNISTANVKTRSGLEGEKSKLWSEFSRIVSEIKPHWVVVENVSQWRAWVPNVRRDLHNYGYASVSIQLCPSTFGACHKRPRVFVVANSNGKGESLSAINEKVANLRAIPGRCRNRIKDFARSFSRDDGLPGWMARAYGNAVHVDIAKWIGEQIVAGND